MTTQPAQVQTDTYSVFRDEPGPDETVYLTSVEVPTHATPESGANKLSELKRKTLAVKFAVESESTDITEREAQDTTFRCTKDLQFAESTDSADSQSKTGKGEKIESFATIYSENPTLDTVWNPNEESAAEFTGSDDE